MALYKSVYYYYFLAHQHKAAGRKTRLDIQNCGCNSNLLCYHGVVERNSISSLQSHGKALEKECCLPASYIASCTIRYDTRCYFNVRSKADMSQLNLPHAGVKLREIPPDLRSGTSCLRSTTSNNRSCTSQLRSSIFLLGSTTLLGRIQASSTT